MNLNVTNVTLIGVGALLIYAAIKKRDPRDVLKDALGQAPKSTGNPAPPPPPNTTPGASVYPMGYTNLGQPIASV